MKSIEPSWITRYVIERKTLEYEGEVHEYLLVSADFADAHGAPRIFVINNEGVLAISNEYPEEYRDLGLIHELIEYSARELHAHSCSDALWDELCIARERFDLEAMESYFTFRHRFFKGLVEYYEGKERSENEENLLARIKHSEKYLQDWDTYRGAMFS